MSRFGLIVLLLIFLVGLGICGVVAFRLLQPPVAVDSILMVATGQNARLAAEDYFAIRLPPAPMTDQFYLARKQDDYWIRFNVEPDQLHGLLSTSPRLACHDLALLDDLRPEFAFMDLSLEERNALGWWTPNTVRSFVGSDCVSDDQISYKMLVDTANPAMWTVYMEITNRNYS